MVETDLVQSIFFITFIGLVVVVGAFLVFDDSDY